MIRSTLLVIDDEVAIASLIRRIAEQCGYEVAAASAMADIGAVLDAGEPTVICLDISMPTADGIELMRMLAARKVRSRILIVSGFDSVIVQSALMLGQAQGLNMVGIVPKPIQLAELRETLTGLLDPVATG